MSNYTVSEIIIIQFFCFVVVLNAPSWYHFIITQFPFFLKKINENGVELMKFYQFICENNPLWLDYYDSNTETIEEKTIDINETNETNETNKTVEKVQQKYEDKYLEKFKHFSNDFYFTELEMEEEPKEYERIKNLLEKQRNDAINEIQEKLLKINEIEEYGGILKEKDEDVDKEHMFTENINEFGIKHILDYFSLQDDYDENPDDIDFEELYIELIIIKNKLDEELKEVTMNSFTDKDFKDMARKSIIDKKLDKFIDNYILEHTPMGNIYMRYNNNKGSFEYFSNNTIPYRYLEPVGRKYVMTYWCKPIFVDIEEELKRAEIRYDDDIKKKAEKEQKEKEELKNPKNSLARMKSYNKDTMKPMSIRPMKNRSSNNILPPQIKASIQNINQTTEKQLLKEKANRYTWEGRLSDFCPLKKIDKKVVNKNLLMTYADFKKIQQEEQNKK